MDPKLPALIGAHDHSTSWLRATSLSILATVFLVSILRRGTRAFIEQIMEAPTAEHGDGQHGDHCA